MITRFKFLSLFKHTAVMMIVVMAILGIVPRVDAAFIPSSESLNQEIHHKDMETVRQFLELKAVKNRLQALGYSSEEIQQRLSILSDKEVHQLATNIDTLTTAGNGMGVVIGLLVVFILVLIILKIFDKQIIIR